MIDSVPSSIPDTEVVLSAQAAPAQGLPGAVERCPEATASPSRALPQQQHGEGTPGQHATPMRQADSAGAAPLGGQEMLHGQTAMGEAQAAAPLSQCVPDSTSPRKPDQTAAAGSGRTSQV